MALGVEEERLRFVANNRDDYWIPGKPQKKKDGRRRDTHNAKPELKTIHERIKTRILRKVIYPPYLFGGLASLYDTDKRHNVANAERHRGARILIELDIENFFPSTSESIVRGIWQRFFNQPEEVAEVLTRLTTYKNMLPQGWKTSSYLAALSLWQTEPALEVQFRCVDIVYTRFVDDITVSSQRYLTKAEQAGVFNSVVGVLSEQGFRIKRRKTAVLSRSATQEITGVALRGKDIALPRNRYRALRAEIQNFSKRRGRMTVDEEATVRQSIVSKIGYVRRLCPGQAANLEELLNRPGFTGGSLV